MKRRRAVVVVSNPRDAEGLPEDLAVPAERYLEGGDEFSDERLVVVNLCRSYEYASQGYYVSLLADARGQRVLPTLETASRLDEPYARFRALQEAGVSTIDAGEMTARRRATDSDADPAARPREEARRRAFPPPVVRDGDGFRIALPHEVMERIVVFGQCDDPLCRAAARGVFREWAAPLLHLQLVREDDEWKVTQVAAAAPHHLDERQRAMLLRSLGDERRILRLARSCAREPESVRASIAVLTDAADRFSPSSPETIDRLERVAARRNVHVARLALHELRRLPEYDALFIRSNTGVTHPAFQFALRAEALDMPVIDDTQSTIRCTNKVFVEELLRREGIPTPRAVIVTANTPWEQLEALGLPFVIKRPDGCFSTGVHKVSSREEYETRSAEMFADTPLIIAQEWLPTDFDWRVGVLGGKLLFAARYFMAKGHWQIRTTEKGTERYGRVEAVRRSEAPAAIVDTALRAARLIGNGFYGVDLKETAAGPVVIEINDNPNLDTGYEDTLDGDDIYNDIIDFFESRIGLEGERAAAGSGSDAGHLPGTGAALRELRAPIVARPSAKGVYDWFSVAGLELEYPIVNRDLEPVPLVEPAFRLLAGRGTSDVELGDIGFSNEFADHVFEVKTMRPLPSLVQAEAALVEGVQRFAAVLRDEFDARLLPTGMHPWFDSRKGRLWTRSGLRIYTTYARLFDVRTHGWMNVHASHLNLPFGDERETMAMHTAASLLLPYLPALAASSPMHDGRLQPEIDARMKWLASLQARVPESIGAIVPEYVGSFAEYRREILQPMYAALDRLPGTAAVRQEFFNARGAVLRFSRRALELRVLDVQECVRMDAAVAAFARAALRHLALEVLQGRVELPPHESLVADFHACARNGSAARVAVPHLEVERDADGLCDARTALRALLDAARRHVQPDETEYLELAAGVIEHGSLAERIRARLEPHAAEGSEALAAAARGLYLELMDCLEENRPWEGRGVEVTTAERSAA